MECEEVRIRLWEYLDQELGPEEATEVQAHIQWCRGCFPAFCRYRALLQLLARQRANCSAPAVLRQSLTSLLIHSR